MERFALVRGVVYRQPDGGEKWHRRSVPPDTAPGKRSKWPPTYLPHRLPAHELISKDEASRLAEDSLDVIVPIVRERTEES
jgi:hypothetical protein